MRSRWSTRRQRLVLLLLLLLVSLHRRMAAGGWCGCRNMMGRCICCHKRVFHALVAATSSAAQRCSWACAIDPWGAAILPCNTHVQQGLKLNHAQLGMTAACAHWGHIIESGQERIEPRS